MAVDTIESVLDDDLRRLVWEVTDPGAAEPFGAYIFGAGEPGADLGRRLEQSVFLESFGNTPEMLDEEFSQYEASTLFICIVDHMRKLPAGMMRVVRPSTAGLKSLNDIELVWGEKAETVIERTGIALDPARTFDVATMAVAADYRRKAAAGLITMGLYQSLATAAREYGAYWLVAIFDMPVFRLIRWKLRMVFASYHGVSAQPYLGSPASIPAWCDLREAEQRLAVADPYICDVLFRGVGLEPALRRLDVTRSPCLTARPPEAAAGR
jgi:hypothetical protein